MVNKKTLSKIILIISIFCFSCSARAQEQNLGIINWNCLGLNSNQKMQIQILDNQWQMLSKKLRQEIAVSQAQLKFVLKSHTVTDKHLRLIQDQILSKQQKLRQAALENFIAKRKVLNTRQKIKLHQMLNKYNKN